MQKKARQKLAIISITRGNVAQILGSGWGREDSDLLIRLLHAGVSRKDGRFATGVIHLWHPEADRAQLPANDALLQAALQSRRTRAQCGLSMLRESSKADAGKSDANARHVPAAT